jgi:endonuclease/exonuclease/phosphatase family metal-dependent hydrolase
LPRIVSYNVRHCRGRDGMISPARIAEVISSCEPDIVALQELDVGRSRSGGIDQAVAIGELLKMDSHFHPALKVMEELYGDAILTALPSRLVRAGPLPGLKRLRLEPRGALWAEIEIEGVPVQVMNTHLGLLSRERGAQTQALLGPDWLGHPDCRDPIILAGDLNAPPWGRSYRQLAGALATGGDPLRNASPPATFPSRFPVFRIDHVIVSPSIKVEAMRAAKTPLARVASDHLPLIVDFHLARR